MKRSHRGLLVLSACTALVVPIFVASSGSSARAVAPSNMSKIQKRLLSAGGVVEFSGGAATTTATTLHNYKPQLNGDCGLSRGSNVKVNQDCLNLSDSTLQGRAQAQNNPSLAANAVYPSRVVAAYSDFGHGDSACGSSYSMDGGRSWNDSKVPEGFTNGSVTGVVDYQGQREYWQAGSSASVAWDSRGNAYLGCQLFNRGSGASSDPDSSSAVVVFRSTQNGGASWDFPGRYVRASNDVSGSSGAPFLDRPLIAVDASPHSTFRDRVYATWTEFAGDGSAFIYEAWSNDYGEHFSSPRLVSSDNATLCPNDFGLGTSSHCNENQYSQPFVGPDGALYVVFANFNNSQTGQDNRNQILLAKSTDGGDTFGPPVKVADYYDLPDCATYQSGQDPGRACVPEKSSTTHNSVFQASNYPVGAVDPAAGQQVVVSFGSYINPHSDETNGCTPGGDAADGEPVYSGVKTAAACNNDILLSVSTDGGDTFTGAITDPRTLTTVNQASGQGTTDQFWQWLSFSRAGRLTVSYYDRKYGSDETNGSSDITLSGSVNHTTFAAQRVTSSSMPPPTEFDGLFMGDRSGLGITDVALPGWSDTRNPDFFLCPGTGTNTTPPQRCSATEPSGITANDQDVFSSRVPVPTP